MTAVSDKQTGERETGRSRGTATVPASWAPNVKEERKAYAEKTNRKEERKKGAEKTDGQ